MCICASFDRRLSYFVDCFVSRSAVKIKKPIKTKFRMPVFNWVALKPNQINGTVFNEIDDERILEVKLQLLSEAMNLLLQSRFNQASLLIILGLEC